jgi:hypothetical protein
MSLMVPIFAENIFTIFGSMALRQAKPVRAKGGVTRREAGWRSFGCVLFFQQRSTLR